MRLDFEAMLSNAQALASGTAKSTNSYDTFADGGPENTLRKLRDSSLEVFVNVEASFNTLTSIEIMYGFADNTALTTNFEAVGGTTPIPLADLTAGASFSVPLFTLSRHATARRHFGMNYIVVGAAPTLGTLSAHLVGGSAIQTNHV